MRNRLQLSLVAAVALLLTCGEAFASDVPQKRVVNLLRGSAERRAHHVLTDSAGRKLGEATRIVRSSPEVDRDVILYRSFDGDQLIIESTMSFATQSTEKVIRNIKGDASITARYKLPFTSKTRDDFFAEARRHPELWSMTAEQLELVTNGGSLRVTDEEFEPARRIDVTKRLRLTIPFDLLETIERATGTVLATEFASIARAQIVDFVVYRPHCAAQPPRIAHITPDCDFDKQFGFPCSKEQLGRAKQAREDNAPSEY